MAWLSAVRPHLLCQFRPSKYSKHGNESLLKMQRIEKIAQAKEVKKGATKAAKAVVDANNKVGKGAQKAVKAVADVNVKAVKKVEKGLKKLKFW